MEEVDVTALERALEQTKAKKFSRLREKAAQAAEAKVRTHDHSEQIWAVSPTRPKPEHLAMILLTGEGRGGGESSGGACAGGGGGAEGGAAAAAGEAQQGAAHGQERMRHAQAPRYAHPRPSLRLRNADRR